MTNEQASLFTCHMNQPYATSSLENGNSSISPTKLNCIERNAGGGKSGPRMQQESAERKGKRRSSRKIAIQNPRDFSVAFANLATTVSEKADDWVARNGNQSIFSVLLIIMPEVSHVGHA